MSKADLHQRLNRVYAITLSVKGRKSGRDVPRPVLFMHEGNTLYLLPVQGSDTNWYKNMLVDPTLKISVNGVEIPANPWSRLGSVGCNTLVYVIQTFGGFGVICLKIHSSHTLS